MNIITAFLDWLQNGAGETEPATATPNDFYLYPGQATPGPLADADIARFPDNFAGGYTPDVSGDPNYPASVGGGASSASSLADFLARIFGTTPTAGGTSTGNPILDAINSVLPPVNPGNPITPVTPTLPTPPTGASSVPDLSLPPAPNFGAPVVASSGNTLKGKVQPTTPVVSR